MKWQRLVVALGAVLVLVGVASSAQPALPLNPPASAQALLEEQPEDRREELFEDQLVLLPPDGLPPGQVEALVLFTQPADKVWALLQQRERQREFRPELTSLSILERTADGLIEEQHLKIAFLKVGYRLRNHFDPSTHTMTWQLDPGFESTLEHVSGYWELHALGADRTLARFGTKVSVSPAVPGFLQNGITRKNVPQTLENTRKWVNSGGTWRP
jgi:ribosome-associated toxin RatA of RatAB toxin-antitoxin module